MRNHRELEVNYKVMIMWWFCSFHLFCSLRALNGYSCWLLSKPALAYSTLQVVQILSWQNQTCQKISRCLRWLVDLVWLPLWPAQTQQGSVMNLTWGFHLRSQKLVSESKIWRSVLHMQSCNRKKLDWDMENSENSAIYKRWSWGLCGQKKNYYLCSREHRL